MIRKEVAVVAYAREERSRSERAISLPRIEASRQKKDRTFEPRNVLFQRFTFCSSSVDEQMSSCAVTALLNRSYALFLRVALFLRATVRRDYPSMIIKIVPKSERLCRSILRPSIYTVTTRDPYSGSGLLTFLTSLVLGSRVPFQTYRAYVFLRNFLQPLCIGLFQLGVLRQLTLLRLLGNGNETKDSKLRNRVADRSRLLSRLFARTWLPSRMSIPSMMRPRIRLIYIYIIRL